MSGRSSGSVVVTGAAGFIGQGLVAALADAGWSVRAVDRRAGAPRGPGITEVTVDLASDPAPRLLEGATAVVHLAARAHMTRDPAADPLAEFRAVNRDATLRLADAAATAGVRRFVFLSSIGVLGEQSGAGSFDASTPAAPTAPYAISKWEAEEGLREFAARRGLELVIIRPTLVHGPGAPGNFARLLRLVDRGLPLPFGGVDARRTFVSRTNLCSLIMTSLTHPRATQSPLLAADPESVTLPELLRTLGEGMQRKVRLFRAPGLMMLRRLPVVGGAARKLTDRLVVDPSETRARLDWTPPLSAREGLLAMARAWGERPW